MNASGTDVDMSFLEDVIRNAARIEQKLVELGGHGSGLYDLASSIRPQLGNALFSRIQAIALIRNKLAHEAEYVFDGSDTEFLNSCDYVLNELSVRDMTRSLQHDTPTRQSAGSKSNFTGGHMLHTTRYTRVEISPEWVEVCTEKVSKALYTRFFSTADQRLVFFSGGIAEVKPIGKHDVRPFNRLDSAVHVKMLPDQVTIKSEGDIVTSEGLLVDLELFVKLQAIDNDAAIRRIALDAKTQQALICNDVMKAARSTINAMTQRDVCVDCESLENEILRRSKTLQDDKVAHYSFRLLGVTVWNPKPNDAEIREYATKKVLEEKRTEELENSKARLRIQDEIEDIQIARKSKVKHEEEDRIEKAATRKADRLEREAEKIRAHALEMEKIKSEKEVAVARASSIDNYIELIKTVERNEGELRARRQIAKTDRTASTSHRITHDVPKNDADRNEGSESPLEDES